MRHERPCRGIGAPALSVRTRDRVAGPHDEIGREQWKAAMIEKGAGPNATN
jgi:hypothetical protein